MNILRMAWMEVRLVLTDRMNLFWMFALPLLMIFFFAKAFPQGSEPSKIKITLGVCSRDPGFLSDALVEDLGEENFNVTILESLEKRAKKGWVRTLIIPEVFTEKVLKGEEIKLVLETEANSNASALEAARVHIYKALARVIGNLCLMEADKKKGSGGAEKSAEDRYKDKADLEPRVLLETSFAGKGKVIPGGYNQTVPGILVMCVLLSVMTYGTAQIVEDRKGGMLRRLAAAPCLRWEILTGKLFGRLFTGIIQIILLLFVCTFVLGFYLGTSPLGWVLTFLPYIFACGALGMLIGCFFRSPEQAATVGWISALVMSALGGCWWPKEIVPKYMQTVGYLFPTSWAMDGLHKLISFGEGSLSVLPQAGVLTGFFVLFMVLCVKAFRYE